MYKKTFLLVGFLWIAQLTHASDFVPPRHTIILGLGAMKVTALDQVNSRLPYSGFGPSLLLGYSLDKGRLQIAGDNTFSSGLLKAIKYPDNPQLTEQYLYDKFNVMAFFRLIQKPEKKLSFLVGPQVKLTLGYRLKYNDVGNSLLAYNIATSTNVAFKAVKYFEFHSRRKADKPSRFMSLEGFFSFPLVSQVWYQPYIGLPENVLEENATNIDSKSQYSATLTEYIDWEWALKGKFFLRNGNAIGLTYNYSYIRTKPEFNPHRSQMQGLMFSLYFSLK